MTRGILHGRDYRSGKPVSLHHEAGVITRIEPCPAGTQALPWLAPSLVDLQVNGFARIDFQRDDVTTADLEAAVRALARAGCGGFLLTLITDRWPVLLRRLARLRELRRQSSLLRRAIAGWHIEGPFLSTEPGYHGAHSPDCMLDPTPERLMELRKTAGTDRLLLTLAPERSGAIEGIRRAVGLGMRVSLGHTNAPADLLARAYAAGAAGFTHLGNACPQALDRHDNILFRVIDQLTQGPEPGLSDRASPSCVVSVIPDGIHVSSALFRLLHRLPWRGELIYVSDAMAAAAADPGTVTLGSMQLEVGGDGIVRQPGRSNFAGSSLRPVEGVWRAANLLGAHWTEVWDRFSVIPAAWVGIPHRLEPGYPANLCLVEELAPPAAPADPRGFSLRVRTLLTEGEELDESVDHGGY